ncbi:hypothetical protein [Rhizorhabdus sp.]|uniref:hypothetical protein n=1 Tax=Rhizorhabdus sp. TaxID=1968843 RepID=UPI0035B0BE47
MPHDGPIAPQSAENWTDAPNEIDIRPLVENIMNRFGADFGLQRYCRTPPDRSIDPIFIDEISLYPSGGKSKNPDGPWAWCSECERPKFWEGIAITNGHGDLYFIGQRCGESFYGKERVRAARQVWRSGLDMRRAVERFAAARGRLDEYASDIAIVRKSKSLENLDAARQMLRAAGGDLRTRLESNITNNDGDLIVQRPFVDARGQTQLAKHRLGPLRGAGLLSRPGYERALADQLETAAEVVAGITDPLSQTASSLQAAAKSVEDAAKKLVEAWDAAARAHEFFEATNLDRIAEFSEQMRRHYTVSVSATGLRIRSDAKSRTVRKLSPGTFQALRSRSS